MSQFSASYSSLEEAWGDSSIAPRKNKRVPKKSVTTKDPICQLYESSGSPSSAYTENDILEYVNSTTAGPATYSRAKFGKSQPISRDVYNQYVAINTPTNDVANVPPQWSDPTVLIGDNSTPKIDEEEDTQFTASLPPPQTSDNSEDDDTMTYKKQEIMQPSKPSKQEDDNDVIEFLSYIDKNASSSPKDIMVFADIGLYILSGIILIFMMEQFVKVGLAMRG